jgi:PAS domain S-box-containing protein
MDMPLIPGVLQAEVPFAALVAVAAGALLAIGLVRRALVREHRRWESVTAALRDSEERFRQEFEHAPIGMALVGLDGRFVRVNRALCGIVGYDELELLARDFQSITHRDDLPPDLAYAHRLLSGELTTYQMDKRYLHKDGRTVWVQLNGSLVRDPGGEPRIFIAQIQDITERRRAEAELRKSRALLAQVLEALPVGVWIMDERGTITYGNRAGQEVWGGARYVGPEQFGDYKGWWSETGKPIEPGEWAAARAIARGETSLNELIDIQCFDGTRKTILNSAVPLRNGEKDGLLGAIIVNEDITARRQLEAQLRQSQKMEAVGRLAGGVAHDFNNLLTVIRQAAELLVVETGPGTRAREDVDEIIRASDLAGRLTAQLLAFSRRQPRAARRLDVNLVAEGLARLLERLMPESVRIRLELAAEPALVYADPVQLEQVLLNLAVNARDAMPQGGTLELAVGTAKVEQRILHRHGTVPPGDYVTIRVKDTGIGMEPETLERIFEPFFTTKGLEGTGLGLPTVYGIVHQSGGHVTVESIPLVSTTVVVYLPLLAGDQGAATEPTGRAVPVGGSETILLVDDDDAVRRITRRSLEHHGYTVLEAAGGAEALDMYRLHSGAIRLLVTDMVMPGMNGRELVERLTLIRPELQVLFISGHTDDELVRQGLLGPHQRFLRKPFSNLELAREVRALLDSTRAG